MKFRKKLFKRCMAMGLAIAIVFTNQNSLGIAVAANDEGFVSETYSYVSDVELPSNDELYEGYVYKEFYGDISTFGINARDRLDGKSKNIYDLLKKEIEKIASGQKESTVVNTSDIIAQYVEQGEYSESDFSFTYTNVTLNEAAEQFDKVVGKVFDALLVDCPYDMYWFNKVRGFTYNIRIKNGIENGDIYSTVSLLPGEIILPVVGNYQPTSYNDSQPTIDKIKVSLTATAVDNAKAIVEANKNEDDYIKLKKYKEAICNLVCYDYEAASSGNFSLDSSPWQLINVFDNNPNTKVVCEGYSKAFQYLCDMTEFENDIYSYIVSGEMGMDNDFGAHMWNIVQMDDGNNYIVDVTNSDENTIGQNGELFITTTEKENRNTADGYTFDINGNAVTYIYDEDTLNLWGDLELSFADYIYNLEVLVNPRSTAYNGEKNKPDIVVKVDGNTLTEGVDYDIEYPSDMTNAGNKQIVINGKGNFTLTKAVEYKILPKELTATINIADKQYDGKNVANITNVVVNGKINNDDIGVDVSGLSAKFESVNVGNNINVNLTGTALLTGADKDNYKLIQSTSSKANIYNNFEAIKDVNYTINSNDWINESFVITAKSGYEISKTNTANNDNWTTSIEISQEGTGTVDFYIRNKQTGAISLKATESYKIDKTEPKGYIIINDNLKWNILSPTDYKWFFNENKQVFIQSVDTLSDINNVKYYLSNVNMTKSQLEQISGWTNYSAAFGITKNSKQYIYVKFTDNAGNISFIGSDGIVIYTDAQTDLTEVTHTKKLGEDKVVTVILNDNTIDELYIVKGQNDEKVDKTKYSVLGNKITVKSEYLDELAEGEYTFKVSYKPFGVDYVENTNNNKPNKTEFVIKVKKNTGTVTITNGDKLDYKFGQVPTNVLYNSDSKGNAKYEYKVKGANDTTYTTTVPVNVGEYTVRVTVEADNYYTAGCDEADFSINKADKLVINDKYKDYIRTVATTNNTFDIKPLLKNDRGSTYYTIKSAESRYLKNVSVSAEGVVKYDTLTSTDAIANEIVIEIVMNNYETSNVKLIITLTDKQEVEILGVEACKGLVYNGKVQKGYTGAAVSEYDGEYVITYAKNTRARTSSEVQPIDAGDYTVTIAVPESDLYYKGSKTLEFSIAKKDIKDATVTLDSTNLVYNGQTLTKNVESVVVDGNTLDALEYKVSNNTATNAGEYNLTVAITTSINYTGSVSEKWNIIPKTVDDFEVKTDENTDYIYNGEEQEKEIISVIVEGKKLDESKYEIVGNKKKESGEHIVIVNLKGNYNGLCEIPWIISKADKVSDVSNNVIPAANKEVSYEAETVNDVQLLEGWVWADEAKNIKLEVGKEVIAKAVYVGEDKDNYKDTTMTITLVRKEKEDTSNNNESNNKTEDIPNNDESNNKTEDIPNNDESNTKPKDTTTVTNNKSDSKEVNKVTDDKPVTSDVNNSVVLWYVLLISVCSIGVLISFRKKIIR